MRLSATLDVEEHYVRFLNNMCLNLWDCGGQDAFYESYFERDRETIFRSVELLIYVFDIESDCPEKDFDHFAGVLEAIEDYSPNARIFVLVHKMDLVAEEERDIILDDRRRLITDACIGCGVDHFRCFGTSIWDETLYKAWSEIVTTLIPNIGLLQSHLKDFCQMCDADEVVLFEKATFLVISSSHGNSDDGGVQIDIDKGETIKDGTEEVDATVTGDIDGLTESLHALSSSRIQDEQSGAKIDQLPTETTVVEDDLDGSFEYDADDNRRVAPRTTVSAVSRKPSRLLDAHRFEKISNIVKQFKLSCGKAQSLFQGMEVRNRKFSAFIDAFTSNCYIMVIVSDPRVHPTAINQNIENARKHFERFIPHS